MQIGYRFLKEEESLEVQTEPPDHETDLWKGIWALNSPNKIKNLIWRACRNSYQPKGIWYVELLSLTPSAIVAYQPQKLHCMLVWSDLALWNFLFQKGFPNFKSLIAWVIANKKSFHHDSVVHLASKKSTPSAATLCVHGSVGLSGKG